MCAWNTVGGGRGAERRQARVTPGLTVLIHCALWDLVESFKWGVIWFKDHSNPCSGSDSPAAVHGRWSAGACVSQGSLGCAALTK